MHQMCIYTVVSRISFTLPTAIILAVAIVLCGVLSLLHVKGTRGAKVSASLAKCLAVFYVILINFRFFTNDSFLFVINGGYYGSTYYPPNSDILVSVLRWGQYMSYTLLAVAVFCRNRTVRNIAIYVCLPFAIANTICYTANIGYLTDGNGVRFMPQEWLVNALWCTELIIAIALPVYLRLSGTHRFDIRSKKEWLNFAICLPLLALLLMPSYIPQSIIGITGARTVGGFGAGHILWILLSAVITMVLYYYFRWKDYETRNTICVLLSLMAFNHYSSIAQMTSIAISITPLQLCNIASVLFIVLMITKSRKLFSFVFLANIVGTIIGMLGANEEGSWSNFWNVRFMYQHTVVLIVPSLMYGLRLFERFKLSDIKDFLIGVGIYWVVCMTAGTLVNANYDKFEWTANWFYMFDGEFATDLFPLFANIINYAVHIGKYQFYPIFQLLVPIVYSLVCLLFLCFVNYFTAIQDDRLELRENALQLLEKRGVKINVPRQFID